LLKVTFDHVFGAQEHNDLQLVKLKLDTKDLDEKEALENGWLINDDEWYQCRSVRIDLKKFKVEKKLPKYITVEQIDIDEKIIKSIYDEYLKIKNYEDFYNIFEDPKRTSWLLVKDDGIPVAFTKLIQYKGGLESQFTAWNYHKPKLSIGRQLVNYEVEIALEKKLDYLYIGQGYEKSCLYKSEYKGFEWWTGSEWSKDIKRYKELCTRDSSINTLEDLSKIFKINATNI
jgi:hypothetical protein